MNLNEKILAHFGNHIRDLRKKRKMTQEDLAFEVGVDRS
jgi:DNA-binding XRE family transcriptional regulator